MSYCTDVEGGSVGAGAEVVGVGVGGCPRRDLSVFLSGRAFGAALTAV